MKYLILTFLIGLASFLSAQNELIQLKINELIKQKDALETEIEQYNGQIKKVEDQLRISLERKAAVQSQINHHAENLAKGQATIEGYDLDQINTSISEFEKSMRSNNKQIKKLSKRVEKNNRMIEKLSKQNEQYKVQIALLKQQNETTASEVASLRETIKSKNLTKTAKRLNKTEKQLTKLNQQKVKINGEIEYLTKQKNELEIKREASLRRLENIIQTLKIEEAKLN
ncbi:MAG: hypothetical protein ACK4EX_06855 [Thermaurantimonas sp.]|uniref:hypothetical protein n=1 Tax=Thermaurantimonas sp. TaxID=2681568 RepID=UPI0039189502